MKTLLALAAIACGLAAATTGKLAFAIASVLFLILAIRQGGSR
ncbi:MAG TPA: hypothetical protein VFX60_18985 [Micromonospora sp.]|nr:hypothetical protein [Micromonospora sp.]